MSPSYKRLCAVLLLRMVWEWFPSLWACALFWGVVTAVEVGYLRDPESKFKWWSKSMALAGAAMNAVVTLANGGRMPVLGNFTPLSVWVTGTGKRLLFLCDRFPLGHFAIFSVGDVFIAGSILLPILLWVFRLFLPPTKPTLLSGGTVSKNP